MYSSELDHHGPEEDASFNLLRSQGGLGMWHFAKLIGKWAAV